MFGASARSHRPSLPPDDEQSHRGTLAFTLCLRARRDLAIGAYVFFACGAIALMIAGVASGCVAPLEGRNPEAT